MHGRVAGDADAGDPAVARRGAAGGRRKAERCSAGLAQELDAGGRDGLRGPPGGAGRVAAAPGRRCGTSGAGARRGRSLVEPTTVTIRRSPSAVDDVSTGWRSWREAGMGTAGPPVAGADTVRDAAAGAGQRAGNPRPARAARLTRGPGRAAATSAHAVADVGGGRPDGQAARRREGTDRVGQLAAPGGTGRRRAGGQLDDQDAPLTQHGPRRSRQLRWIYGRGPRYRRRASLQRRTGVAVETVQPAGGRTPPSGRAYRRRNAGPRGWCSRRTPGPAASAVRTAGARSPPGRRAWPPRPRWRAGRPRGRAGQPARCATLTEPDCAASMSMRGVAFMPGAYNHPDETSAATADHRQGLPATPATGHPGSAQAGQPRDQRHATCAHQPAPRRHACDQAPERRPGPRSRASPRRRPR